jgi:hypothetical protein
MSFAVFVDTIYPNFVLVAYHDLITLESTFHSIYF